MSEISTQNKWVEQVVTLRHRLFQRVKKILEYKKGEFVLMEPDELMEQEIIELPEFTFWFKHGGSEVCHLTRVSLSKDTIVFEGSSLECYCVRINDSQDCISTDSLSQLSDVLEKSLN